MKDFINKFKIPTILGLAIIFLGIGSGIYLVLKDQVFISRAAPNVAPQNVTFSNITDTQIVVSWQTNSAAPGFVTFGQNNPSEQTALDDRDSNPPAGGPTPRLIHYVSLKNLLPKTKYQLKIISGKITSEIFKFETSSPFSNQTGFNPIIGVVLQDDNTPLDEGIAYLSTADDATQSAPIKADGNFLIPLSSYNLTEGTTAKITIISGKGNATLLLTIKANLAPLPPVKLGQNVDLTLPSETPQPTASSDLNKYDLNGDGEVNSADYAIILRNFGPLREASKNPKNQKADLNNDGVVDQKDLDLMSQKKLIHQ